MKLAREIAGGVLVTALFLALATVLPVGAAVAVVVPFMVLLALAEISEHRARHTKRVEEVMPN